MAAILKKILLNSSCGIESIKDLYENVRDIYMNSIIGENEKNKKKKFE